MMRRLRRWFPFAAEREQDLAREIESHLVAEAEEQTSGGLSPDDARAAALRRFGNVGMVQEDVRASWGYRRLDQFRQDLRYGFRGVRRNPGFAAVIVVCLSLGIGANTAIFSVLNQVLLRPLPIPHPEQLYAVDISESKFRAPQRFSYPLYAQMRAVAPDGIAAMSRVARMYGRLAGDTEATTMRVQLVSGEFFPLLGITPALGRFLAPSDNLRVGDHPVAVVSHAFWTRRMGASSASLGRIVKLNGAQFTIVGVAPAAFHGLWLESPVDVWIPLMMQAAANYQQNFSSSNAHADKPWPPQDRIRWLDMIVRNPNPALSGVFRQWLEARATEIGGSERQLFLRQTLLFDPVGRGYSSARGQVQRPLLVLAGMVALVLLIACANAANLLLARGAARRREMALRLSLGATRYRLIRQLLTETCILAGTAGAIGMAIAYLGAGLLVRAALGLSATSPIPVPLDWRVWVFTLVLSVVTAVVSGLAPAFRTSDAGLGADTKAGTRAGSGPTLRTLQRVLVASQIALVLVLLTAASWFSNSLRYLARMSLGYDQDQVVTVWVRPELAGYRQEQLPALHRRLVESTEALPGAQSAAFAMCGLASGCRNSSSVTIEGYQPAVGEEVSIQENRVGLNYFATVGMRSVAGRDFRSADSEKGKPVAIVNQTAVRRYFAGGNAIGRRLGYGRANVEVVGIVADARVNSEREPAPPMVFYPLAQGTVYGGCVQIRFAGDATGRIREIREALARVDPDLPIESIRTVRDQVNGNLRRDRLIVWFASIFGAVALMLASFGIYGVLSYTVARRTNEIGVRLALGAAPRQVFRLAFGESLTLLAVGLAVGAPLVWAASRPVSGVLAGADVADPSTPLLAIAVVGVSAVAAAWLPARRAARVDPMVALRYE